MIVGTPQNTATEDATTDPPGVSIWNDTVWELVRFGTVAVIEVDVTDVTEHGPPFNPPPIERLVAPETKLLPFSVTLVPLTSVAVLIDEYVGAA